MATKNRNQTNSTPQSGSLNLEAVQETAKLNIRFPEILPAGILPPGVSFSTSLIPEESSLIAHAALPPSSAPGGLNIASLLDLTALRNEVRGTPANNRSNHPGLVGSSSATVDPVSNDAKTADETSGSGENRQLGEEAVPQDHDGQSKQKLKRQKKSPAERYQELLKRNRVSAKESRDRQKQKIIELEEYKTNSILREKGFEIEIMNTRLENDVLRKELLAKSSEIEELRAKLDQMESQLQSREIVGPPKKRK